MSLTEFQVAGLIVMALPFLIAIPFYYYFDGAFGRLREYLTRKKEAKRVLTILLQNLDKQFKRKVNKQRKLYREVYQILEDRYYEKKKEAKKSLQFGLFMIEKDYCNLMNKHRTKYMDTYWAIYKEGYEENKRIKPDLEGKWSAKRARAMMEFGGVRKK